MNDFRFLTEGGEKADVVRQYLRQLIRICVPFLKMCYRPDVEATIAGVRVLLRQGAHEVILPPEYTERMQELLFTHVLQLVRAAYSPSLEKTLEQFEAVQEKLDMRAKQPEA